MKATNLDAIYPQIISSVLNSGKVSSPRGRRVKEIFNVGFQVENALNSVLRNPLRKTNQAYQVIEMMGLLRNGAYNVEPFTFYCPPIAQFLNPDTNKWDASYASRIMDFKQMDKMYQILTEDPNSRRAVIQLYTPQGDFHTYPSRDISCTLSLIFRLRDGKLDMTSTIRGNDVFLGLPYDATQYTFLQNVLASWLNVEVGSWYHFAANMHAYEENWEQLEKISQKGEWDITPLNWRKMELWDILDPKETYSAINRFFQMEKWVRNNLQDPNFRLETAFSKFGLEKSKFIRNVFTEVVYPFLLKKFNVGLE